MALSAARSNLNYVVRKIRRNLVTKYHHSQDLSIIWSSQEFPQFFHRLTTIVVCGLGHSLRSRSVCFPCTAVVLRTKACDSPSCPPQADFGKIPAHNLYPARVNGESLFQLENARNKLIACMHGDSSSIFGETPVI